MPVASSLALALLAACNDLSAEPAGAPTAPAPAAEEIPEPPGLELLRRGQRRAIEAKIGPLGARTTYALDLSISDLEGAYRGRGTIRWTNNTDAPQNTIPLLLHPNAPAELGAVDTGSLVLEAARVTDGPDGELEHVRPTLARLALASPIEPGQALTIEVDFRGQVRALPPDSNDLFKQAFSGMASMGSPVGGSDYGLMAQGDGILTLASAFPTVAPFRDGAPVTSEPSRVGDLAWNEVCNFDVRIVAPAGLQVVTNLRDRPAELLGDGAAVTRGAGAAVRDLIVVASRDWAVKTQTIDDVAVRSWSLSRDRGAGEAALAAAAESVTVLNSLLGDYPYTELDVVEATLVGGAGGVEFSGLVLIAGFLYRDPSETTHPLFGILGGMSGGASAGAPPLQDMLAGQRRFVVAHEVAHQWSPGIVGVDSHAAPVVDEPLAQYLAGRVLQEDMGIEDGGFERERNVLANYAMFRLMGGADGPAARPVSAFGSSLEYGALVYGKAPYLYAQLEEELGRPRFDRALAGAFDELAWGVVDADGWTAALEANGMAGAGAAAERWWSQAHGDEDLGLDPEGRAAMALILGPELAAQLEQSLGLLGMRPADLFKMMGGAPATLQYDPTAPSTLEMLELLDPL